MRLAAPLLALALAMGVSPAGALGLCARAPLSSHHLARAARMTATAVGDEGVGESTWWSSQEGVAPAPAPEVREVAAQPEPPEEPPGQLLEEEDIINTRWKVLVVPREEGWLPKRDFEAEFTLLADGSVVWGGEVGGYGIGGRWTLRDETLEVIRTTPLGLVTGRDYYMTSARAEVTEKLQFAVRGVIRSYNAAYPVAVIADFVAVRMPGRFVLE